MTYWTYYRLERDRVGRTVRSILGDVFEMAGRIDDTELFLRAVASNNYETMEEWQRDILRNIGQWNLSSIATFEMRNIIDGLKEPYGICPGCGAKGVRMDIYNGDIVCQNDHVFPCTKEQLMDVMLNRAVRYGQMSFYDMEKRAVSLSEAIERLRKRIAEGIDNKA